MSQSSGGQRRIRVLVADDSRFMRMTIGRLLASDPEIEVVGMAADGLEVIEAVRRLAPQVVTLDVCMPHADGLVAVERLMAETPIPIVMISSQTQRGSATTLAALEMGAVDFVCKPAGGVDVALDTLQAEIVAKVRAAARVRPVRNPVARPGRPALGMAETARPLTVARCEAGDTPCVVVAASTGGPAALLKMLPQISPLDGCLLIVQHMPAYHTALLARELAARSRMPVKEAEDGERLVAGVAYVAPGSTNLTITACGAVNLGAASRMLEGCPSADLAMASVARHWGRRCLGVVLTGMGRDGSKGVQAIRKAGGLVVAQDEASSLIYGMPQAAIATGCVDAVVPLTRLPELIQEALRCVGEERRSLIRAS